MSSNLVQPRPTFADDSSGDRLVYASFPAQLKAGMKAAAQRWNWDRETWRYQTALIMETLRSGRYDAAELAVAYHHPPPGGTHVV